jgi:hypothetical protein
MVVNMSGGSTSNPVAPVANAGAAQSVVSGTTVTLDSTASSAAAGKTLTYAWTLVSKPAGSTAALVSPTAAKPTIVVDLAGSYVASVIVSDGTSDSSAAAVTITVTASDANASPIADLGLPQRVVIGAIVSLDGSASSDANGDPLTYSWTLTTIPSGSLATLTSLTEVRPSFIADLAGTYVASLSVNDGKVSSVIQTTTITSVPRIAGALGIALSSRFDFCGIRGQFTVADLGYFSPWTVSNCGVFGNAGSMLFARIQNNGSTALTLTNIDILAGIFAKSWNIDLSSQTISPGSTMDFALPLWMSLEVTNATATFSLTGEPNLVVQLKGSVALP